VVHVTDIPRVDVSDLKTYQQVYTYIMAIITNMAFINVVVIVVRLWWFKKKLMCLGKRATQVRLLGTSINS
jgi:hypothetical protein